MYIPIIIFYSGWLILTCIAQFYNSRIYRLVSKIDVFHILPLWTFFAPNPGVSDYHLLYRTKEQNGEITSFKSIDLRKRKLLSNALWNPHKRKQKTLIDFVQELRAVAERLSDNEENKYILKLSFSYIVILHYCSSLAKQDCLALSVQFAIVETFGYYNSDVHKVVLNSDFHTL